VNDEITIHNFGWGLSRDDKPAISFTFTLPNGGEGTFGWEEDADDTSRREALLAHYEQKLLDKLAGSQGFTPTVQGLGFEPDKGDSIP
jgi:hypothetical protein